jgi:hydroxypyruvate isomerase
MRRNLPLDRRHLIASAVGAAAVTLGTLHGSPSEAGEAELAEGSGDAEPLKGRIRQSVMGWCFKPMPAAELAQAGKKLGLVAIEGIDAADYPAAKAAGLDISLVGSHGFAKGPVDTQNHAEVEAKLRESIDLAVKYQSPSVITFTGMRVANMRDEVAKRNCLDCWKRVIKYAEEHKITLCLEHLNSRDSTHPMKGHPGYFGDDVELCIELIKAMDSPRFKLLFDIYHVQIMNGDVIRRIREHHAHIGHYHTAGNPGRGELDDKQEINYPPIMRAILETGFEGFVAQEFIPTWPDKIAALDHAVKVCDV